MSNTGFPFPLYRPRPHIETDEHGSDRFHESYPRWLERMENEQRARRLTWVVASAISIACMVAWLFGCAPIVHDRELAISQVTTNGSLRERLREVPVTFVAGMPECGPRDFDQNAYGCYRDGAISIATVNWHHGPFREVAFRDESEIQDTLRHEYRHALQWILYGKTWHPVTP